MTYCHAIARTPPASMASGITTQHEGIDLALALEQHAAYLDILRDLGIKVTLLGPEEAYPDSHFVEDTAIIHSKVAILTRPGAQERRGEVDCMRPHLEHVLYLQELGGDKEATVDGGDILFMGNYVYIGISYRTNYAGAEQLKSRLLEINPSLSIHFIPFEGVLHLKSGLTALGPDLLLGSPDIKLHHPLPAGHITWLPREEAHAANVLVANGAALIFNNSPAAHAIAHHAGLKPITLDISEFRKMDGSFTCLSLLW